MDAREIVERLLLSDPGHLAGERALQRSARERYAEGRADWLVRRVLLEPEGGWRGRVPLLADTAIDLRLEPRSFGHVSVVIGAPDGYRGEHYWYRDSRLAWLVAWFWDCQGEPPDGWVRHTPSNRRRPEGDPSREIIRP